jgi:hypothetical protein
MCGGEVDDGQEIGRKRREREVVVRRGRGLAVAAAVGGEYASAREEAPDTGRQQCKGEAGGAGPVMEDEEWC